MQLIRTSGVFLSYRCLPTPQRWKTPFKVVFSAPCVSGRMPQHRVAAAGLSVPLDLSPRPTAQSVALFYTRNVKKHITSRLMHVCGVRPACGTKSFLGGRIAAVVDHTAVSPSTRPGLVYWQKSAQNQQCLELFRIYLCTQIHRTRESFFFFHLAFREEHQSLYI